MMVTVADNMVMLVKMHRPILVDYFIWSFQKVATGTTASTESVTLYRRIASTKSNSGHLGLQQLPGVVFYYSS